MLKFLNSLLLSTSYIPLFGNQTPFNKLYFLNSLSATPGYHSTQNNLRRVIGQTPFYFSSYALNVILLLSVSLTIWTFTPTISLLNTLHPPTEFAILVWVALAGLLFSLPGVVVGFIDRRASANCIRDIQVDCSITDRAGILDLNFLEIFYLCFFTFSFVLFFQPASLSTLFVFAAAFFTLGLVLFAGEYARGFRCRFCMFSQCLLGSFAALTFYYFIWPMQWEPIIQTLWGIQVGILVGLTTLALVRLSVTVFSRPKYLSLPEAERDSVLFKAIKTSTETFQSDICSWKNPDYVGPKTGQEVLLVITLLQKSTLRILCFLHSPLGRAWFNSGRVRVRLVCGPHQITRHILQDTWDQLPTSNPTSAQVFQAYNRLLVTLGEFLKDQGIGDQNVKINMMRKADQWALRTNSTDRFTIYRDNRRLREDMQHPLLPVLVTLAGHDLLWKGQRGRSQEGSG